MALLTPENLSKRRRYCGLSQKELAARANIDVNIVARLETSRRKMTQSISNLLTRALNEAESEGLSRADVLMGTRQLERWEPVPPAAPATLEDRPKSLAQTFRELSSIWKQETEHCSSMTKVLTNPSYLSIIGLGLDALPLIFEELRREPHYWFAALRAITRQNPVPDWCRGDREAMARIWLDWGKSRGFA